MPSKQILAFEEDEEYLWLLMRPIQRHGKPPGESSWWRKTLRGNELVEVGERPVKARPEIVRITP